MDLLTISFYVLLFVAFPFGEIARLQFGNGIALTLLDICVGITAFAYLFTKKQRLQLFKPLIFFFGICILSLLFNFYRYSFPEITVSALYILRFIAYSSIYFSAFSLKNKSKALNLMLIPGVVILILGIIQYFFYPYLGNLRYLGWDDHLFRLFSSFLDPNFAGAFFTVFIFLVIYLIQNSKRKINLIFLVALGALDIISLFLTYSRTAYVMFLFGIVALAFLQKSYRKYILIGLIFILFLGFMGYFSINKHSEGTNLLRITSTFARTQTFQEGLSIFVKNPILGVGFNAYRYALYQYGYIKGPYWQISHGASTTDNSFLFVAATTGILGLIVYVYLWYNILRISFENKEYKSILIPTFISLIIGSLFVDLLFYPTLLIWIWTLIGITESN